MLEVSCWYPISLLGERMVYVRVLCSEYDHSSVHVGSCLVSVALADARPDSTRNTTGAVAAAVAGAFDV